MQRSEYCTTCIRNKARKGQATCANCHNTYMREWRKKNSPKELRKEIKRLNELLNNTHNDLRNDK